MVESTEGNAPKLFYYYVFGVVIIGGCLLGLVLYLRARKKN
jgi:hypothetical protein